MTRNDASERQVQAASPQWSTWLSANAGSGKTRVLTDRVARLLLAGVEPARILCLTYTKAAASEMQNRLFRRLGSWAMLEDDTLRRALLDLGVDNTVAPETLIAARRLFARAIETPGGLRIQTIHSFCATLLRRFPLEARVSPQFTELDDRSASLLRDEIVEEMADRIAPETIRALARAYTGEDFAKLASEVARQRAYMTQPLNLTDCLALFDIKESLTAQKLCDRVLLGGEVDWLGEVATILKQGSVKDIAAAEKIATLALRAPDLGTLRAMEEIFLSGAKTKTPFSAKIGTLPTKATQIKLGDLLPRLDDLMGRIEAIRPLRIALQAAQKTATLHQFAAIFLPLYAARKQARGALDFDDLITRAKMLLTDPQVAQWVLFRLDGGIDHILVDEAQDTSPDQWRVIELLAQEFTSGRGARDVDRTIFVVGDQKQSIYSFQGADVAAFARMRETFNERLTAINAPFQKLELEYSFRSSPTILRLVDLTFDERSHRDLGGASKHLAFKDQMPGRIEMWPPILPATEKDESDWFDPIDLISKEHHAANLGRKVAARIKELINSGAVIPSEQGPRAVHAGDFLILVRKRNIIFREIIRACKEAGLPIAGADRLKLGAELAVKDLTSLLAFLATPEDDLALAEALRSPLFGWTEQELFDLAQPRDGYLWAALRKSEATHAATLEILRDLRDQADYLRPYDLIERALTRHGGRSKLLSRLGAEAEDGIDELLAQSLTYETSDVPSLTGFLTWLQTDDVEVKRQADSAGRRIRVMTVHGAKGLEAPIVILPDTNDAKLPDKDELLRLENGHVLWRMNTTDSPEAISSQRRTNLEKAEAESLRLLYVALTRAQCWLIIASAGELASHNPKKTPNENHPLAWYDRVKAGMHALGATPQPDGGSVYETGVWQTTDRRDVDPPVSQPILPAWLHTIGNSGAKQIEMLSPSNLGGAKILPSDAGDAEAAMQYGTNLHMLFEVLPSVPTDLWDSVAKNLLPNTEDLSSLIAEFRRVVTAESLQQVFSPSALAEVAITGELDGARIYGTIDRLLIYSDHVLAVDFKSNRAVPTTAAEIPDGIRRQMAAYSKALAQIYPSKRIRAAILWTKTAELMEIPSD